MKNLVFTLIFLLAFTPWCRADNELKEYDRMMVTFRDGSTVEIPLRAESSIHGFTKDFEGTKIKYVSIIGDGCEYEYRRSDILSFRFFASEITGLQPVFDWEGEKENLIDYQNGQLTLHPQLEGETLRIYDLSGRVVLSRVVPRQGVISLSSLNAGVYVVNVKKYTLQIVKS